MTDQEKNEAVARRLGVEYIGVDDPRFNNAMWNSLRCPDYCRSIEAAWGILNYVASNNGAWDLEFDDDNGHVLCTLKPTYIEARAPTAPMAIVDAFIKLP